MQSMRKATACGGDGTTTVVHGSRNGFMKEKKTAWRAQALERVASGAAPSWVSPLRMEEQQQMAAATCGGERWVQVVREGFWHGTALQRREVRATVGRVVSVAVASGKWGDTADSRICEQGGKVTRGARGDSLKKAKTMEWLINGEGDGLN